MWTIDRSICLAILAALSVSDMRHRKVSGRVLLVWGILTSVYQILCRPPEFCSLGMGALVGVLFLFISKVTAEGFGYGDSLAILILGIYLGVRGILCVLSAAFLLLAVASVLLLWMKKMNRKSALPFFPFLTVGYLAGLLSGYL